MTAKNTESRYTYTDADGVERVLKATSVSHAHDLVIRAEAHRGVESLAAQRIAAQTVSLMDEAEPTDDDLASGDWLAEHALELTPAQLERAAELVAKWNPRHAVAGWATGAASYGRTIEASIYDRALELLDERVEGIADHREAAEAALEAQDARVEELAEVAIAAMRARNTGSADLRAAARRIAERFGFTVVESISDAKLQELADELGIDLEGGEAAKS